MNQAKEFHKASPLDGLIVTKLGFGQRRQRRNWVSVSFRLGTDSGLSSRAFRCLESRITRLTLDRCGKLR